MCEANVFQMLLQGLGLLMLIIFVCFLFLIFIGGPDLDEVLPTDKKGSKK